MEIDQVMRQEQEKLAQIFEQVDENKRQLVEGLINDAAFLFAQNYRLRELMAESGMIKIHPTKPELQKPTETARQYLKNTNAYAVIIKTLNGILSKDALEPDDELENFLREHMHE